MSVFCTSPLEGGTDAVALTPPSQGGSEGGQYPEDEPRPGEGPSGARVERGDYEDTGGCMGGVCGH